jgi:hypothetical protein
VELKFGRDELVLVRRINRQPRQMDWRGAAFKRYLTPELIAETTVLSRTCSLIGGSRERPTASIVGSLPIL